MDNEVVMAQDKITTNIDKVEAAFYDIYRMWLVAKNIPADQEADRRLCQFMLATEALERAKADGR